jgi:tetratricopeptide (TPR) repeat protein
MAVPPDKLAENTRELQRLAERSLGAGRLAEAQQACLRILSIDRNYADAYFLLGVIAASVNRAANALEFIDRAISQNSNRGEFHAHRAKCLSLLRRDGEAVEACRRALELGLNDPLSLDTVGVVLSRAGQHDQAADVYRRAVALAPKNPSYAFNLATALKFTGDFDESERAYEAAIRADETFWKAHSGLAQLRRQTPDSNHVQRLRKLLEKPGIDLDARLHLSHALAKELEDLGRYDEAFRVLEQPKREKRRAVGYSSDQDAAIVDALIGLRETAGNGYGTNRPVFVMGLPRTGTTLVERILSSHREIASAGETQAFSLLLKQATRSSSPRVLDQDVIRHFDQLDWTKLGADYERYLVGRGGDSPRVVDKTPLNFLLIGAIRRALPGATLICLRRHPLDSVLSNFRQLFSLKASYYDYSFDIEDAARYYTYFDRLMTHWRELFPESLCEVQYESLVANQEAESRRLVAHCGLDWDPACLAFEQNAAAVATASAVQVREGVYTRAVERWKRYEKQLEPARRILEEAGIAL